MNGKSKVIKDRKYRPSTMTEGTLNQSIITNHVKPTITPQACA